MKTQSRNLPCHRTIVAVDIEASTTRNNSTKAVLRNAMYDLVEEALHAGGISRRHRDRFIDRGDGILILVHPADRAPKAVLLNPIIPTLNRLLATHNVHHPNHQFRLRAVVHAGEVHYDRRGCFGEALDVAFRLLDAPEVKAKLCGTIAPLVLVVSDDIFQTVVRQGYDGVNDHTFEPLVHLQIADRNHSGWVHLPTRLPDSTPAPQIRRGYRGSSFPRSA